MKKILHDLTVATSKVAIVLCLSLCSMQTFAQTQNWTWAKSAGGIDQDQARKVAVDAAGNIYVAGFFGSSSLTLGGTTLSNNGGNDILLVKYDPSGTVTWAKSVGSTGSEGAQGLCIDGIGNVYISGVTNSPSLNFGGISVSTSGGTDIFIAKYSPAGNIIWALANGGSGSDEGQDIAVDGSGNLYLAGHFTSPSINFGSTSLNLSGSREGFLAKYDSAGTAIWARAIGGTGSDRCIATAVNISGEVIVSGYYFSTSITIGTATLTSSGGDEAFVAKYDAAGNVQWAKSGGGSLAETPRGISTDANGNIYICGYFNSSSCTFGNITLSKIGGVDPYLVKYDNAGNVLWAKNNGGTGIDVFNGIATDATGNSVVIGNFDATYFVGGSTLSNSGLEDILIIKYDASGNVIWAKKAGGSAIDLGYGVCSDASGNLFLSGQFESSSCSFGTTTLFSNGAWDIFVAKINAAPTGVEQFEGSNIESIYPNPATEKVFIVLSVQNLESELILTDLTGKICYTEITTSTKTEIDTRNLPAGIYSVTIRTVYQSENRKLIIIK